ncbi:hypothetical protein [Sphingomonas sp.]|uniref:hypothetical protein n=1 Tax=Sphingomonas sp. TaxID=28214 RepID=UPI003B00FB0F
MATQPTLRMGTTQHARLPAKAKKGARPVIPVGGTPRPVPLLSGAVGRPPSMNAAADVTLVEAAFQHLATLRPAPTPASAGAPPPSMLALAEAVRGYKADLPGAIAAFQRVEDIREDAGQSGIMAPDSLTWETLFTYAEIARELETVRDRTKNPIDYIHSGGFDTARFETEAAAGFAKNKADGGRFNTGSSAAVLDLLGRCARDPRIVDVRWIAYILATAMWETNHQTTVPNAKGKGTHRESRWAEPVEEGGKGRLNANDIKDYYLPVKVTATPTGATVLEQDGDSFDVSTSGKITKRSKGATHGAPAAGAVSPAYVKDLGIANAYYGRGYVQLTWWDNYASTGAEVGLGLELLFHPERALEPDIAFEVMVHGMVYGLGFANGRRLQNYLSGAKTDYVGARAMVNGTNENRAIAAVAEVFEAALLAARI